MKRWMLVVVIAFGLWGCTTTTERPHDRQKSAQVNAELGLRYMFQGNNQLALEKLQRALEQDPNSAIAHHYMAELYRRLEEFDDADKHYRRAIELAPEDSSTYNNYGVFLCSQKRYEDAEKQFLTVLKNPVYTGRAHTLENLGLCMREGEKSAKAEEYFRKALQLDPRLPTSLLAMAEISLESGNALSARGYVQRFGDAAPHTPQSLWLGIRIERVLGDKSAVDSYGMLLKNKFPDSDETGHYLRSLKR